MIDFKLEVYDGTRKIFDGLASDFLKENDCDENVADSLEHCRLMGECYIGGGAAADFELVRKD